MTQVETECKTKFSSPTVVAHFGVAPCRASHILRYSGHFVAKGTEPSERTNQVPYREAGEG